MLARMTETNPHRLAAAAHLEACRATNSRIMGDEFLSWDAQVGLRESIQDGLAAAQVQATLAVSVELAQVGRILQSLRLRLGDLEDGPCMSTIGDPVPGLHSCSCRLAAGHRGGHSCSCGSSWSPR